MAFPTSSDWVEISRSLKGSRRFIYWFSGPTFDKRSKTVRINTECHYFSDDGEEINDPDIRFTAGWERPLIAKNDRIVSAMSGEILTFVPESNNYIDKNGDVVTQYMTQYEYFVMLGNIDLQMSTFEFVKQIILAEDRDFHSWNKPFGS